MPVIRQDLPQVERASVAQFNPTATPTEFGANQGAALEKVGTALTSIGTDTIIDVSKGAAKQAYNDASTEFNAAQNQIFADNQGTKLQDIPKLLADKKTEILSKYSTGLNPLSSSLFTGSFSHYYSAVEKQANDQLTIASRKFHNDQSDALIDNLSQQSAALKKDDPAVNQNHTAVLAETASRYKNMGPEIQAAAVRDSNDNFWSARVLTQGQVSATAAMNELNSVKGQMSTKMVTQLEGRYATQAHAEQVDKSVNDIMATAPSDGEAVALASKAGPEVTKGVIEAQIARNKNREFIQGTGIASVLDTLKKDPNAPIPSGITNPEETYAIAQMRANDRMKIQSTPSLVQDLKQVSVAEGDDWKKIPSLIYKNQDQISAKDGYDLMATYGERLKGADITAKKHDIITDGVIKDIVIRSNVSHADYDTKFVPVYDKAVDDFSQQQGRQPTQEEKLNIAKKLTMQVKSGTMLWWNTTESMYKEYGNGKLPVVGFDRIPAPDRTAIQTAIFNNFTPELKRKYPTPTNVPNEKVEELYSIGAFKNLGK